MASMSTHQASSYTRLLLLGAIAATSAFVVTIIIVLLCVGCRRKGRMRNGQMNGERHSLMDGAALRKSKMRSISKSDTGLHEMSRLTCNGGGTVRNRPASMDLLYVPSRQSHTDLRGTNTRQLPKIPAVTGDDKDHTYSEVGQRASPTRGHEDGLYESVGSRVGEPEACGAKANGKVEQGSGANVTVVNMAPKDPVTAEYACIRKVRKADKSPRRNVEAELPGTQPPRFSDSDLPYTSGTAHPRSHEMPRKNVEPFQMHSFPKETMFLGNGEQYIWKPPEEDDITPMPLHQVLPDPLSALHNDDSQDHSLEIAEMYSKVCKPSKKKWVPASSETENSQGVLPRSSGFGESEGSYSVEDDQVWADETQLEPAGAGHHIADPCYESVDENSWTQCSDEGDPAYETIDANWKCGRSYGTTPKTRNRPQQRPVGRALPAENFYESISDVKQGLSSSSTTTIFTFNDGMEMYVTGL